jgi:hypothetical protein
MELERLKLALRHRSAWEAADLGLVLLRHGRGAVYRAWFATVLPFIALLYLMLWRWPLLPPLLAWWCKPLFDRVLLQVYAGTVFGEPPSVRQVWRALPGLVLRSGLGWSLTLGRFDAARSFHLPVAQLEGQRGRAAELRRRTLDRKARGCAVWLTVLCAHFSMFFQISLVLLIGFFWPVEAPFGLDWEDLLQRDSGFWASLLPELCWLFGESLAEPFYVAAGFTLYLNRRSELEGWDIELGFRQLAQRHAAHTGSARRALAWLGLALGLGLVLAEVPAESLAAPAPESASTAKQAIQAVLEDPAFGKSVPDWEWRRRPEAAEDDDDQDRHRFFNTPSRLDKFLKNLAEWIALSLRALAYLAAALLAVALAVQLYRHRQAWRAPPKPSRATPDSLFGLDLRPESLPANLADHAARLLAEGAGVQSLSLLYRGALAALVHTAQIDFQASDTEGDCRERVRGRIDPAAEDYFAELLDAWSLCAYAHSVPPTERLRDLCQRWPRHFAEPARPDPLAA